jgi:hypothetical protein
MLQVIRRPVTMQEWELLRHGAEAQLRWALVHGGDQELIEPAEGSERPSSVTSPLIPQQIVSPAEAGRIGDAPKGGRSMV